MTSIPIDQARSAASFPRPTLLLIDEHKIMRDCIEELVKRNGDFEVINECGSLIEGLNILRERPADVIVIGSGSRLQDLDGIQATRLLLRKFPAARIVILSANEDEQVVLRAIRSGAVGFVLKKSHSSRLFDALRAAAESRSYIDPDVTGVVVMSIRHPAKPEQRCSMPPLTCRESEILSLITQGKTSKEIAVQLSLGVETVRSYRKTMMKKLDVSNIASLLNFAFRTGLIQRPAEGYRTVRLTP